MTRFDDESNGGTVSDGGGLIGALIQTGGALYDSAQNRKTAKENTDKTIAAAKSEAELAYQRSVERWNAQNLYNSPQAQMQRFIDAGLNPHLIYGQGSPGNATGTPEYHPANMQYKYEAPAYGAAVGSLLPTLMSVGTWMQNMRLSESELQRRNTDTQRSRQMIDFLQQKNPKLLEQLQNQLDVFPYQAQAQSSLAEKARLGLWEMGQEFRYKYGDDLWKDAGGPGSLTPIQGIRKLQFLEQESKTRLSQAKASWSDFNITDPQAIMQLVLSGVMGLAGQTLRLSTHRSPKARVTHETESRMRGGRVNVRRRIYER